MIPLDEHVYCRWVETTNSMNHGKIGAQMKIWGIFLCLKMGAASRKMWFWCRFHQGIWHRAQERLGCCGVPGALCAEPKLQNGTWAACVGEDRGVEAAKMVQNPGFDQQRWWPNQQKGRF